MEHKSALVFFICLCFTGFINAGKLGKLKYTPVRVIDVKNGMDNDYFAAVTDTNSPTGWAIQIKKNLSRYDIDNFLLVYMFDNTPKTNAASLGKYHRFFATFMCDLLIPDSRYDKYPEHNNMPRDMMDLVFPGQQGLCNMTQGHNPILATAKMNTAEYDNPMVRFPDSSYYEVTMNVLSQSLRSDLENKYFFQVKMAVGTPPRYCLKTRWNYYIVWRTCTIFEFIESTIAGIGKGAVHIF